MEASQRREYSKLLMVPIDGDGGMSQFNFTQSPVATWKNIIDDLMVLGYEFAIYNKINKKFEVYECNSNRKYKIRYVEKSDEYENLVLHAAMLHNGGSNSMDAFMFQASWRLALIYQACVMNDLDRYWLFYDESDCFPTEGYEPDWTCVEKYFQMLKLIL